MENAISENSDDWETHAFQLDADTKIRLMLKLLKSRDLPPLKMLTCFLLILDPVAARKAIQKIKKEDGHGRKREVIC